MRLNFDGMFDGMIKRSCRGVPLLRAAVMGSYNDVVANVSSFVPQYEPASTPRLWSSIRTTKEGIEDILIAAQGTGACRESLTRALQRIRLSYMLNNKIMHYLLKKSHVICIYPLGVAERFT